MDAMAGQIRPFEVDPGDHAMRAFDLWIQRFRIYLKARALDKEPEERQVNILLNLIGEKGIAIYNSFNLKSNEANNLEVVIRRFTEHFSPKWNLIIQRHKFFTRSQLPGEKLEDYFTAVINVGLTCEL